MFCLLLRRHGIYHRLDIASNHISFLLLGSKRSFSALLALLAVLLLLPGSFGIFAYCSLFCVSVEDAQVLGGDELRLACFLLLLDQNAGDGLVHSLSGGGLEVLILTLLAHVDNVLVEGNNGSALSFFLLGFLCFAID